MPYHKSLVTNTELKIKMRMIGLRIYTARKLHNWNQYQLGYEFEKRYQVKVSHMKIHRWESGKYPINMADLLMLAEITGQNVEYFFKE